MKKIKHTTIFLMTALAAMTTPAVAQTSIGGVDVDGLATARNGAYITVDMNLRLSDVSVSSNRAMLLTPRIVAGRDSLLLPPVAVYGRRRYYYYRRNGQSMLTGSGGTEMRAAEMPDTMAYHALVPYEKWMEGAALALHREDYGCCHTLVAEADGIIGHHYGDFFPELVYIQPQGEAQKRDSLEGSAFIDFPVDKIQIYPDYRRNTVELGKIQATIDSVRSDRDITITSVWLKGYASPESPYSHNRDLARGRTAALKNHIQQLYHFADGVITTDFEPEDWAGLRRYVDRSNLKNREEILRIIDSGMEPDAREAAIKRRYPADYRFLLDNCYPALRHTDYRIAYTIRSFSDVDEIRRIMREHPQKLSQNEFYLVAQTCEPGTDEFTEVFETAVRMFPTDSVANLNAANAAIRRDDLDAAERYLDRAGHSPKAIYTRGALAIRRNDLTAARRYLSEAAALGLPEATVTLRQLDEGRRRND